MSPESVARVLAVNRTLIGAGLTLAPGRAAAGWIGPYSSRPGAQLMARGLGARDVAIGVGALRALARGQDVRTWALAGLLSDGVDLLATVAVAGSLPLKARAVGIGMTGASTAIGAWLALELE